MAAKRRRKQSQGEIEEKALAMGRWSGLNEQRRLEQQNHSERENCAARRRTREFLEGGWGSIDWIDLYGQK
ncbi:hypothetical protein [Synechococcus sp. CC9605]|uniref:hypothetical protein n=1 Tax=Synechococcus sp. (strain CC9605) TaxID=110662 RepID=UPI0002F9E873|nr:hypothetical protein [Synechococcus sp. CC9605]